MNAPSYLPYVLQLRAPAILPARSCIPGRTIRGAVAERLRARGIPAGAAEFHALVRSDATHYLSAYPEVGGARSLPWPADWGLTPEARFVEAAASGEERHYVVPKIRVRIEGPIREALAPDQRFRGAIAIWPEARAQVGFLKELLARPLLIGRSRLAGYGGLAEIRFEPEAAEEFPEATGRLRDGLAPGDRFRALLTSAYLGRHPETGQLDPAALPWELIERLGEAASIEGRSWSFEPHRSRAPAVAAGAVLLLRTTQAIGIEALRVIEHEGLGEGRRDGHGRLLFLAPPEPGGSTSPCLPADEPARIEDAGASKDEPQLAFLEQRIVLAAARAELDRHATDDLAARARSLPDRGILGRLRGLLDAAHDERSAQEALERLGALEQGERDQLEACALPRGGLRDWLRKVATGDGPPPRLSAVANRCYLTDPAAAALVLQEHARGLRVQLIRALLTALARRRGAAAEVPDA